MLKHIYVLINVHIHWKTFNSRIGYMTTLPYASPNSFMADCPAALEATTGNGNNTSKSIVSATFTETTSWGKMEPLYTPLLGSPSMNPHPHTLLVDVESRSPTFWPFLYCNAKNKVLLKIITAYYHALYWWLGFFNWSNSFFCHSL